MKSSVQYGKGDLKVMSKIGRKAIEIGSLKVDITGQSVQFQGPKNNASYTLPKELEAQIKDTKLFIVGRQDTGLKLRELNRVWGLHRSLLANEMQGALNLFEQKMEIHGLGYKVATAGSNKLTFSLGYSHKVDFELPQGITVDIDKTGQRFTVKGIDKRVVGLVCSKVRALRAPEPYKGTGIKLAEEVLFRKAGKAKSS